MAAPMVLGSEFAFNPIYNSMYSGYDIRSPDEIEIQSNMPITLWQFALGYYCTT